MIIQVEHVSKKIGQNVVLNDISLKMESGKIYGLKGCNGSGKTMLMRCLCGLIYPTSGRIMIDGAQLGKDILIPSYVNALIESPSFLHEYSGKKNLRFLADLQGNITDESIANQLQEVGLDAEDRRPFRKYSLGMKQRLGIAAALLGNPQFILLDEPMNAIDEEGKEQLRAAFFRRRDKGCLIVMSDHDSSELNLCSDVVFEMKTGKIENVYQP